MKFKLETEIPEFSEKIEHGDKLVFFGSCFSDEIATKFLRAGFDVLSNPFGTIFNPISLAKNIDISLKESKHFDVFKSGSTFLSWNCSHLISGESAASLELLINNKTSEFENYLRTSTYIFITFGSSIAYELIESNKIVANCHKQTPSLFLKKKIDLSVLVQTWTDCLNLLYSINPNVQIVFTVSPVRHYKDSLIENNRSKARLFELISELETLFPCKYYPTFEIIMDELRDYRFFKEDLVHPSQQAINFIWEGIINSFFNEKTQGLVSQIEKLRLLDEHKILSQNLKEIEGFEELKQAKIAAFLERNQIVKW